MTKENTKKPDHKQKPDNKAKPDNRKTIICLYGNAAAAKEAIQAYCDRFGYQSEVPNPKFDEKEKESRKNLRVIKNPVTEKDFFKNQILVTIKKVVLNFRKEKIEATIPDVKTDFKIH